MIRTSCPLGVVELHGGTVDAHLGELGHGVQRIVFLLCSVVVVERQAPEIKSVRGGRKERKGERGRAGVAERDNVDERGNVAQIATSASRHLPARGSGRQSMNSLIG